MLADNIKKYRKLNNMSQDDLAEKLGVSRQSISLWETGQTQPTIDNIVALAKVFSVSADALLDNDAAPLTAEEPAAPAKKKKPIWLILLIVALVLALIGAGVSVALLSGRSVQPTPSSQAALPADEESDEPEDEPESTAAPVASQTPVASAQGPAFDLFAYCRDFAVQKGHLNGDYGIYRQPATNYGGRDGDYIDIFYWAGYDKVEISLYRPLNSTEAYTVYLIMRGGFNGTYEFVSSEYYRSSGDNFLEASGTIDPASFSNNYPLSASKYKGDSSEQTEFLEYSRVGMCDLIRCLKKFVEVEQMNCGFDAFGFKNF